MDTNQLTAVGSMRQRILDRCTLSFKLASSSGLCGGQVTLQNSSDNGKDRKIFPSSMCAEKMRALSPFRALNVSLEYEENYSKLSLYILKFCIV